MQEHYLTKLFSPKHIAVIGASDTPGSTGQAVLANVLASKMSDKVTPVNVRHKVVGGLNAASSVTEIKKPVDVAVVVTRPKTYENILNDCHRAKIPYVLLIKPQDVSETFEHKQATIRAVKQAERLGIRLQGASLFGMIRPCVGLNISTYNGEIVQGNIALVSQSSGLCTAILDWASRKSIGFSTVISLGDVGSDIKFGEILDFLVHDKATEGIVLHIHHINDGRALMSALRAAARMKPVVVIKSGRAGEKTDDNDLHVGDVFEDEVVFSCALKRAGVLQVFTFAQMFTAVRILAAQYRLSGNRLAIISNGSGLGAMAADAAYDFDIPLA